MQQAVAIVMTPPLIWKMQLNFNRCILRKLDRDNGNQKLPTLPYPCLRSLPPSPSSEHIDVDDASTLDKRLDQAISKRTSALWPS